MKNQLETYMRAGTFLRKTAFGEMFSKLDKRELLENVILLLLCRICFMGYLISPFGIAYFSAMFFQRKRLSYVLCAIVGMLSVGYPTFCLKYGGALAILLAIGIIFSKELSGKIRLQAILSTSSLLLNGAIYVVAEGFFAYDVLMLIVECSISFLSFFAFSKASSLIRTINKRTAFEPTETVSLIALCGAVIFSVALIDNLLPFAHVLAVTAILILSTTCGFSLSCPAGAVFGLCLGIAGSYPAQTVCVYCIASLASGFFKQYGKAVVSFTFFLCAFSATLLLCPESGGIITAAYVALGALVLFLLPDHLLKKFGSLAKKSKEDEAIGERLRQTVENKISETISCVESVGVVFKDVLEDSLKTTGASHSVIFENTAEKVCRNCSLYKFCWNKSKKETLDAMEQMYKTMERKNSVAKNDIPPEFTNMCIRRDAFLPELIKNYESYKITRMWEGRVTESKRLVAEQFQNISMILKNMKESLLKKMSFEPELEQKILSALDRRGILAKKVSVCAGDGFSVSMDKVSCGENLVCATTVAAAVSEVLEVPMLRENRVCSDHMCHLAFSEQTRFVTDIATASATRTHSSGSGDSFLSFPYENGKIALVLSDGMGSGEKAHFLSSVTTRLSKNLLSAGFDKETCVRLINNILMANAERDSFATLDMCIINLYLGTMEFVKMGSGNSYVKTSEGKETIYASSLPAGLVHTLEPDYDMRYIRSGDYLIMVSDGISDVLDTPDHNEIFDIAKDFSGDAQTLANNILNAALGYTDGVAYDDMTVVVCAISESM